MPVSALRSLKRSKVSGLWFVGRHARGLCVKTCTASQPKPSARSIAVWMPPEEETCAPKSTGARLLGLSGLLRQWWLRTLTTTWCRNTFFPTSTSSSRGGRAELWRGCRPSGARGHARVRRYNQAPRSRAVRARPSPERTAVAGCRRRRDRSPSSRAPPRRCAHRPRRLRASVGARRGGRAVLRLRRLDARRTPSPPGSLMRLLRLQEQARRRSVASQDRDPCVPGCCCERRRQRRHLRRRLGRLAHYRKCGRRDPRGRRVRSPPATADGHHERRLRERHQKREHMSGIVLISHLALWLLVLVNFVLVLLLYRHFGLMSLGTLEGVQRDGLALGDRTLPIVGVRADGTDTQWTASARRPSFLL